MTYQGRAGRVSSIVLRVLVVAMIIWIAYWASTGGLQAIEVQERPASTSTTVAE